MHVDLLTSDWSRSNPPSITPAFPRILIAGSSPFPYNPIFPFSLPVIYSTRNHSLSLPLRTTHSSIKHFSINLTTSTIPFATMAIYSSVPPPDQQGPITQSTQPSSATSGVDIESWSATAISSLNISASTPGGVTLSIPLDADRENDAQRDSRSTAPKPRKELMRRDSQKKREALLRGKEGSRRRQRWENGEF